MFNPKKLTILSMSVLLALLLAVAMPLSALADDDTPPTDAPVATDESTEDLTIPEILDAAPEGTDLVVLDESGIPLPLATEAAAEVILSGDPMWCPVGKTPADGVAGGCTIKFSSLGDLITELSNATGTDVGAGTIYVSFDYSAATAGDAGHDIVFDHDAMRLTNLVVQGGWNFSSNALVGDSVIDLGLANMLNFHDWEGSLTLNNVILTNSQTLRIDGRGLDGVAAADVTLNHVGVMDTEYGAIINTSGDVAINNSEFIDNGDAGAFIWQADNVSVTNSVFTGNAYTGARIWILGNAEITDDSFNGNWDEGASISTSGGSVTISNSMFNGNAGIGSDVGTFGGDIIIHDSEFSDNSIGLQTQILKTTSGVPAGDMTLNNVTAEWNMGNGAYLNKDAGYVTDSHGNTLFNTGNIFVNGGNFSHNGQNGLYAFSFGTDEIRLTNVTAVQNESAGAWVSSDGNTTINGGSFVNNQSAGLQAFSYSEATLNNISATGNGSGAEVTAVGNVTVNSGNFSNNAGNGLGAWSLGGDATLNNVTATGNESIGASVYVLDGSAVVNGGNFSNNNFGGLWASSDNIIRFVDVTAVGNAAGYGFGAGAYGNLDVICGNYSNNGYGLFLGGGNAYLGGPNLSGNELGAYYYLDSGTVSFGACEDHGQRGFVPQNNLLPQAPVLQIVAEALPLTSDQLPAEIPEGTSFVSEFNIKLLLGDEQIDAAPRGVQVAFDIPAGLDAVFTVLFWNGTQWVEIPSTVIGGRVVFSVTTPGIYVLASR